MNRDIPLNGGRICAAGELDFRGTMGVDRDVPVGFRAIDLRFELDPALSDAEPTDRREVWFAIRVDCDAGRIQQPPSSG